MAAVVVVVVVVVVVAVVVIVVAVVVIVVAVVVIVVAVVAVAVVVAIAVLLNCGSRVAGLREAEQTDTQHRNEHAADAREANVCHMRTTNSTRSAYAHF